jgi:hypothetical protein
MTNGPIEFQLAASFDWEALVPILFFVLYGIFQLLGSKKKGNAADEEPEMDDGAMEERARRIREEIRRKIEERRQPQQDRTPQTAPASRREVEYDPTVPEGQQRRPQVQPRTLQPQKQARPVQRPEPVPAWQPQPVPVTAGQSSLEKRLQEQRALLEKSRREREEARSRAKEIEDAAGVRKKKRGAYAIAEEPSGALRKSLLVGLRDPMSVRRAVLYREILDPPLGLR